MSSKSALQGWESYPENLSGIVFNGYEYNFQSYRSQLKDDSARLFVHPTDTINVKVIHFGSQVSESVIERRSELDDYLQNLDLDSGLHLILIPQQGSWGRLVVDEPSTRKIFTRLNVFPPFVDILRSFGQRTGFEDDSAGGIYLRSDRKNSVHETGYLVKQVEEHGRRENTEPWSIRQMGVYHRTSASGNAFIVLNPSKPFRRRLRYMQEHAGRFSPQTLHAMILSSSMENWRWYITDLEKRYIKMKGKAQLTRVDDDGKPSSPTASIRVEDTQEIQVLQDKCQQLAHVLDLDREVLQQLQKHFARLPTSDDSTDSLPSLLDEGTLQVKRVDRLLKRLDGTIALTRTILDFRCLASLQHNSVLMTQMTGLTHEENLLIRELTEKAARDTGIMKWITFLTLIYLPASFVATMMGMDYITVRTTSNNFSIHFAGEFWIFFVLTAVFLLITMSVYFWYIRRNRKSGAHDSEKTFMLKPRYSSGSSH